MVESTQDWAYEGRVSVLVLLQASWVITYLLGFSLPSYATEEIGM